MGNHRDPRPAGCYNTLHKPRQGHTPTKSSQVTTEVNSKKRKYMENSQCNGKAFANVASKSLMFSQTSSISETISEDQLKSVEEAIIWCQHVTDTLNSKRCQDCKPKLCSDCKFARI